MIVWSWSRYLEAPEIFEIEASPHMIFLIDEVEAHLHPRWQRVIVPAILKAVERVQADMEVQVLMTTHSPMVLASLEPIFEEEKDQLFNFRVDQGVVKVDRLDREKQGDATGWLESAVFGLGEARSKPAEEAIERANEFLRAAGGTPSDAIVV
jgi:AAA15 family ATPase/GTPase